MFNIAELFENNDMQQAINTMTETSKNVTITFANSGLPPQTITYNMAEDTPSYYINTAASKIGANAGHMFTDLGYLDSTIQVAKLPNSGYDIMTKLDGSRITSFTLTPSDNESNEQ
jgi:hypothetical protein